MRPWKWLLATLGAAAALWAVVEFGLTWVLRRGSKPAVDATRRLMGRVVNPAVLWLGERVRLDQSVIHHVGRRSGREYATPVCTSSTPEGFVVPLAFGTDVDWLRNIRAAGEARLVTGGTTYRVLPEEIDADTALRLAGGRPGCDCWRTFRVQRFLLLRPEAARVDRRPSVGSRV